jgi:hypothetical protein
MLVSRVLLLILMMIPMLFQTATIRGTRMVQKEAKKEMPNESKQDHISRNTNIVLTRCCNIIEMARF